MSTLREIWKMNPSSMRYGRSIYGRTLSPKEAWMKTCPKILFRMDNNSYFASPELYASPVVSSSRTRQLAGMKITDLFASPLLKLRKSTNTLQRGFRNRQTYATGDSNALQRPNYHHYCTQTWYSSGLWQDCIFGARQTGWIRYTQSDHFLLDFDGHWSYHKQARIISSLLRFSQH